MFRIKVSYTWYMALQLRHTFDLQSEVDPRGVADGSVAVGDLDDLFI